jgi:hypothetical protein
VALVVEAGGLHRVAAVGVRAIGCGAVVAAFVLGLGMSGARASGGATVARAACIDPVVHDRYDGFHVGVPSGWDLSSTGGLIVVSKDYTDQNEGFVQTAYVGRGQSPQTFLSKVLAALTKRVTSGTEAVGFHTSGATSASLSGHVGSVAIAGAASVSFVSAPGAHGSQIGVVSGYWAPASRLGAERAMLASIGACYGPEPATLFRFYKDQAFGYTLPLGWTKGTESSDLLFLDDGPNASASYLFVGPYTASEGVTDGESLMRYVFGRLGLAIDRVLSTVSAPNQTTATGATQQEFIAAFLGHLKAKGGGSKPLHGVVRVISSTTGGVTSGVLRIALATPALWNSLNGALIWAMYGIEHDFTQDLAAIQQAQEQLAGFSRQVAGFDQVLNGTDLVQDPSTGIQYEAPYSAWQNNGPNGAGYYIGNPGAERKLTVIAPQ